LRQLKISLPITFALAFFALTLVSPTRANATSGNGSADNPVLINNCAELQAVQDNLEVAYALNRNISCTGVTFVPIGHSGGAPFTGSFDGRGYMIKNLHISQEATSVGLFGVTNGAVISNFALHNPTVTGDAQVGALVGLSGSSTISGIRVDHGVINGASDSVGGLAGEMDGTSIDQASATDMAVTGHHNNVGGLVGMSGSGDSHITNSYVTGVVRSSFSLGLHIGGLLGLMVSSMHIDKTYTATIITDGDGDIGGLIGLVWGTEHESIDNSFAASPIVANSDILKTGAVYGILTGPEYPPGATTSNDWFDAYGAADAQCAGTDGGDCTAANTAADPDPDHFKGNNSVEPLAHWNFDTIWQVNEGALPSLYSLSSFASSGAPNENDADDNGTDDAYQPNINNIPDFEHTWSTVLVPDDSGCSVDDPGWANPEAVDTGFDRKLLTMAAFTLHCHDAGVTVPVTIIYDKEYDTTGWVLRHYNQTTEQYSTVADAVFGTTDVAGVTKTTVTYNITDGGALDSDGEINGVIVDPVAPATVTTVTAPATGLGGAANH